MPGGPIPGNNGCPPMPGGGWFCGGWFVATLLPRFLIVWLSFFTWSLSSFWRVLPEMTAIFARPSLSATMS